MPLSDDKPSKPVTRGESYVVEVWWQDGKGLEYAPPLRVYDSPLQARTVAMETATILKAKAWPRWDVVLRKRAWQNSGGGNIWLGDGDDIDRWDGESPTERPSPQELRDIARKLYPWAFRGAARERKEPVPKEQLIGTQQMTPTQVENEAKKLEAAKK